ncbi:hypothetical protein [Amycolatopsis sp. lyj-84]|uniref:hypothetical protein n=1 Tax=Amycolatopsis sp. lyj-84 TaxID=2789284 RepID=UPI00397B40F7
MTSTVPKFDLDWALKNLSPSEVRAHHIHGPELRKRITQAYECNQGLGTEALAEAYNCSPHWIKKVIRESDVAIRPVGRRRGPRPYTDAQLRQEYVDNKRSVQSISVKYSANPSGIYRDITRLRIELRSIKEQFELDRLNHGATSKPFEY